MASLSEAFKDVSAVVLTGGSSGIGKSFIEMTAKLCPSAIFCNLSRSAPHINFPELKLRHIPCDLGKSDQLSSAVENVLVLLTNEVPHGRVLLINNSGFGAYGRFLESNLAPQVEMVDVNIRAMVDLTARLLPMLVSRGGGIINIASTAAFQPTPRLATYGATKAFVLHWTLALAEELRGSGVTALAVCPGATETGFGVRAGLQKGSVPDSLGQTPDEVVKEALEACAKGQSLVITGWKNRWLARAVSFVPKTWAARLAGVVIRKATGKA